MKLEDIPVAIEHLKRNEGDAAEKAACLRAAEFLRLELVKRDRISDARVAKRWRTTVVDVAKVLAPTKREAYGPGWDKPIKCGP